MKNLEKICSDFYDKKQREMPLPEGWTAYEDFEELAFRAKIKNKTITDIEVKSWKELVADWRDDVLSKGSRVQ